MGGLRLTLLLFVLVVPGISGPASGQARPGHFSDIEHIACAEGAERYLPGDYYFCAANKALQAGNPHKARTMYEESARWGDKRAMFNLGLLLVRGDGLPRDEALGLAWLALAAERAKDLPQREVLAAAWGAAKPEVRDAANALWNAMKLEYADRYVLSRAQQRYERETRRLRQDLQRDPLLRIQIAGVPPPQTGIKALDMLDRAAAETILRPYAGKLGTVTMGSPELVRDTAKPAIP